jgi:thiol-disulfide isomerase/thioredoxin
MDMLRNKLLVILSILAISSSAFAGSGYKIKVRFHNLKDTTLILGHHFSKSIYPDDTLRLNSKGIGYFSGKKKLDPGLYIVFVPSKGNYFDIIIGEDQRFSLETDTADYIQSMKVKSSKENKAFFEYQKYLITKRKEVSIISEQKKNADKALKDSLEIKLKTINEEVNAYTEKLIVKFKGTMFGKFLLSLKEIKIPDAPRDAMGNITDSTFQYKYYRNHYFDYFDVSDPDLLRTPFYESKVMTYLDNVLPQIPDTLNNAVDMLIAKSRTTPDLFKYMLVNLFNHYAQSQIMGLDAVVLYIAEKYYIPEASWSDSTFINKLKQQVKINSPLTIGKPAPDIQLVQVSDEHFMAAKTDTSLRSNVYVGNFFNLRQVSARFTVLVFWEADCSHCKKSIPELSALYPKLKEKDVQVVAVSILFGAEGKKKWVDFVNDHKLYGWINAWNPYSYTFKELYDVTSTPIIYIFDRDMKIVAKRIGVEQIEEIIDMKIKQENSKK